mmetsp:Transcript_75815/g.214831  ORF Transcript_75815/g.214831 Transcript_75815/m.214831 type:complete len:225 (+) Transcript_75815:137-811(+)
MNVDGGLEFRQLPLHLLELGDLLVERIQRRDGRPDVDGNPLHDLPEAHALLADDLHELPRVLPQEGLERLVQRAPPQVDVLVERHQVLLALQLGVIDELRDQRQQALHLEVLLDLVQVVARLRVEAARHHSGHGEEVLQPAVDGRPEGVPASLLLIAERRVEDDLAASQLNLDIEQRHHLVPGDDERIQNLAQVLQRHRDGGHEALYDDVVHEVHVSLPGGGAL